MKIKIRKETFPLRETFAISRESKNQAQIVYVELQNENHIGKGECVPYSHYGESPEDVMKTLQALAPELENGLCRQTLQTRLKAGAARNALDCALWDLQAKQNNTQVFQLLGLTKLKPCLGAITISLSTPEEMYEKAKRYSHFNLIKIKLGGDGDFERLQAIRKGAPNSTLIVDANEGWNENTFEAMINMLIKCKVKMVEQPLPAQNDESIRQLKNSIAKHSIFICADESCHTRLSLDSLEGKYDMINIKLDKSGGLTEALALCAEGKKRGFKIMVGSMISTSLSMAPALLVGQNADYVDLDSPLLLAKDREYPMKYIDDKIQPPSPKLWG